MPKRILSLDIATALLILWLLVCAILFLIDRTSPSVLQPLNTRPLLPSQDVI